MYAYVPHVHLLAHAPRSYPYVGRADFLAGDVCSFPTDVAPDGLTAASGLKKPAMKQRWLKSARTTRQAREGLRSNDVTTDVLTPSS